MPYFIAAAFIGGGYVGFKLSGSTDELITLLIIAAILYLISKRLK